MFEHAEAGADIVRVVLHSDDGLALSAQVLKKATREAERKGSCRDGGRDGGREKEREVGREMKGQKDRKKEGKEHRKKQDNFSWCVQDHAPKHTNSEHKIHKYTFWPSLLQKLQSQAEAVDVRRLDYGGSTLVKQQAS